MGPGNGRKYTESGGSAGNRRQQEVLFFGTMPETR
jgi:hypothetical protein